MNEAEKMIEDIMQAKNLHTLDQVANALGVTQAAVSLWRKRNSVEAIKRTLKKRGEYTILNNFQNSSNQVAQNFGSIAQAGQNEDEIDKLYKALRAIAHALGKEEKLKEFFKNGISQLPAL